MASPNLDHLLDNYIDAYLMEDLVSMESVPAGIGLPLVQTVMAGIELLGRLEHGRGGWYDFRYYWGHHLIVVAPVYAAGGLDGLFHTMLRHGIAHTTLVMGGSVALVKHQPSLHLRVSGSTLFVDCAQLSKDFRKSYEESFLPGLDNGSVRQGAEARATQLIAEAIQCAQKHAATIATMPQMAGPPTGPAAPAVPASPQVSIGVTGPAAPAGPGGSWPFT
jgi:hypothetical protein